MAFSNINELNDWLFQIPKFSTQGLKAVNYNLDSIKNALTQLNKPQNDFFAVHIAGTNGKGSTVRLLESIYHEAGFKTGVFTSPHLIRYNERVRVGMLDIEDEHLLIFFNEYKYLLEREGLSFFEISTLLAFWYFSRQKIDIAIIETGLGGRLDATNVLENKVGAITSIDFDHMDILGNTLSEIAKEKAGIMRPEQVCVLSNGLRVEAEESLMEYASSINANVVRANQSEIKITKTNTIGSWTIKDSKHETNLSTSVYAHIQENNLQTAVCLVEQLQQQYTVSFKSICDGIQKCKIPARFEPLVRGKKWFFDGCHNLSSLQQTVKTASLIDENPIFVLSFMQDKVTNDLKNYINSFKNLYLYSINNPRAWQFNDELDNLKSAVRLKHAHFPSFFERHDKDVVVLGGSFYFYSIIKKYFDV